MAELQQVRVQWSSDVGIDGVSTFYCRDAVGVFLTDLRTFFDTLKGAFPTDITFVFPGEGNVISDATGQNTATWIAATPAPVSGTGTGSYAKPVGAVVNWSTALFVNGRQVRGKTFLVPCNGNLFNSDGTVENEARGNIRTAANALADSAAEMAIYSVRGATNAAVTSASVPNLAAVLRSRRD